MCFTRNFNILLASLALFFVSVFSVLSFLLFSAPKQERLIFEIYDMTLFVGESGDLNYNINFDDAEVFFSIADSSVAKIEKGRVMALSAGRTTVRGSANKGNEICYASANLTVLEKPVEKYRFEIEVLGNGYYAENTLYLNESLGFKVNIFDSNNEKQNIESLTYRSTCESLTQEVKIFFLEYGDSGEIYFFHELTNFSFHIYVKSLH